VILAATPDRMSNSPNDVPIREDCLIEQPLYSVKKEEISC